jgi:hypothetical protein
MPAARPQRQRRGLVARNLSNPIAYDLYGHAPLIKDDLDKTITDLTDRWS